MSTLTSVGTLKGTLRNSTASIKGRLAMAISEQTIKLIEEHVIAELLDGELVESIKAQVISELTEENMLVSEEDRTNWNKKLNIAVNPNNPKNLLVTENS